MNQEIILITGAARGMGKALAIEMGKKGYIVLVSGRDQKKLNEVVTIIKKDGGNAEAIELDVAEDENIKEISEQIKKKYGHLDILVNNAGIYDSESNSILKVTEKAIIKSLQTNSFGPLKLIQHLYPVLEKSMNPRIINVSSGMGSLNDMDTGAPAYRISKTVLNVITILCGHELKNSGVRINSICPGWVQTDMGGESAPRSLMQGIAGMIALIDTPKDGPTGGFFRDGQPIQW